MSRHRDTASSGWRPVGRASRADVRAAYRSGRGARQGRRHPWLPLFFRWLLPWEWSWYAARERGRRAGHAFASLRWWVAMALLSGAGLAVWTYGPPSVRWVALLFWVPVAVSVLNA
jgi:hypothetical protein